MWELAEGQTAIERLHRTWPVLLDTAIAYVFPFGTTSTAMWLSLL
jgi:hypothetical protein